MNCFMPNSLDGPHVLFEIRNKMECGKQLYAIRPYSWLKGFVIINVALVSSLAMNTHTHTAYSTRYRYTIRYLIYIYIYYIQCNDNTDHMHLPGSQHTDFNWNGVFRCGGDDGDDDDEIFVLRQCSILNSTGFVSDCNTVYTCRKEIMANVRAQNETIHWSQCIQ